VTRQTILGAAMSIAICDRCRGRGKVVVKPCEHCRGRGSVTEDISLTIDIPAGIDDGTRMRVPGRGAAGEPGGRSGDLYVDVAVATDPRFVRHGADLVHRIEVGMADAALGTEVAVPTVDGDTESITLPAGTQPGTVFKISRRGMPRLRSRGRGDLLVEVVVTVPTGLSRDQQAALEAFSATLNGAKPSAKARKRR
jgi:molecular chaperone DnaJ